MFGGCEVTKMQSSHLNSHRRPHGAQGRFHEAFDFLAQKADGISRASISLWDLSVASCCVTVLWILFVFVTPGHFLVTLGGIPHATLMVS